MKVYLVQHGEATREEVDPARPLTPKGREDVEKVGKFLGGLSLDIGSILHSGKTRALETAQILAKSITPRLEPIKREGLLPNDPVEPFYEELLREEKGVMVVGHLPFLAKLASMLLTGSSTHPEIILFRMGGVVSFSKEEGEGFRVEWMVIPEILR
jgi:phosphohistidine phosphatase